MNSIKAANSIAGSSWIKTPLGQMVIYTPDNDECYRGPATSEAIEEGFKDEHPLIIQELLNALKRADALGTGFLFQPINIKQIFPKVVPHSGSLRV